MRIAGIVVIGLLYACASWAQAGEFVDDFDSKELQLDASGRDGWAYMTGDGQAVMSLARAEGVGIIEVDARQDQRNIWWALIRRSVSASIDGNELQLPDRELRVEARIRSSHAPRRVNLHFNHSRTTDFHSHLMEFDIATAGEWDVISMTTRDFDAGPDDEVFVQLALMDWGRDLFRVEVDYIKVSVVDPFFAGPDLGEPLPYRAAIPPVESFAANAVPAASGIVDHVYPQANLGGWTGAGEPGAERLLAVSGTLVTLMRWDPGLISQCVPTGWGMLELSTERVYRADTELEEFGMLRVVEILGGDLGWHRDTVTLESFLAGDSFEKVLNEQMIVDVEAAAKRGGKTHVMISPPVLRRLFSGRTRGLAILGQGSIHASFYSPASPDPDRRPRLFFNIEQPDDGCRETLH
jgi:hypothetical protein